MRSPGGEQHTRVGLRRSIRTKGLVVIALPFAVVLANLGLATWFTHVGNRAMTAMFGAQNVLVRMTDLQTNLLSAQANGAVFLYDHDPAARSRYTTTVAALPAELRAVEATIPSAGQARSAVARAAADARAVLQDMGHLAVTLKPGQVSTETATLGRLDVRFGADVSAVRLSEDRLTSQQHAVVDASRTAIVVLGAIDAVAVLVGGTALSLLFTNRVVGRVRRLERATDALARGAPVSDLPGGTDELGRLGGRLAETAALLRHHERALERSRESLDDILAASPVVSLRYDTHRGVLVYASPNVEAMLGVSAVDIVNAIGAFLDRLHPDDVATIDEAVRDAAAGKGHPKRSEHLLRFRRRGDGGMWREARVTTAVVTDSETASVGYGNVVAYLVDVTEQLRAEREAEERRNLLESILAASPDHIVVRDATDVVMLSSLHTDDMPSDAAASVASHPDSIAAHGPLAAVHGHMTVDDRREIADLVRRTRTGEAAPGAVVSTVTTDLGEQRIFETRARPVVADDGRIIGTVTVSRDVTERFLLEASLRDATDTAMAASEAKSEFLSRMSHELRTPLNAVLGFAQLMALDELSSDQEVCVNQIQRAGRHLLSLINEVLDIARIETGNVNLSVEPVSVDDVMHEVATLLGPVADSAGVHIRLATAATTGSHVRADRQRLLQVLLNLGSNAVKYNRPGGLVALRTEHDDHQLTIAVSDTGPGIPPERQSELFVPFSRLGAEQTGIEGTGVGLALSKHLVDLMNGTIDVESELGRGATFRVTLCLAEPPGTRDVPEAHAAGTEGAGLATINAVTTTHLVDEPPATAAPAAATPAAATPGTATPAAATPAATTPATATPAAATPAAATPATATPAAATPTAATPAAATPVTTTPATATPATATPAAATPAAATPATATPAATASAATASAATNGAPRAAGPAEGNERPGTQSGTAASDGGVAPTAASPVDTTLLHGVPPTMGDRADSLFVLHIEDDESSAELVAQVLARRPNIRLSSVGTARLGWQIARRHRPDLILLDIHLPDMPGNELLHRLRSDPELCDVPVIAVSADATPTRIRRVQRLGVHAYLTKPLNVGALLNHVDTIARAKAARPATPATPPVDTGVMPPATSENVR